MTQPTQDELEANIIRFQDIDARAFHYRPRDMLLSRSERERFPVIGRPGEGSIKGIALGHVVTDPEYPPAARSPEAGVMA
jgi:hypothetical protein